MALTPLTSIIILFILFGLSLRNPAWGIAAYLTVYVLYNPDVWWGAVLLKFMPRPSYVAIIFILVGCLLNWSKLNWKITKTEILIYLFVALCWFVTFAFGNIPDEISRQYLEKLTKIAVFIFLMIRSVRTLQEFRNIVLTLLLAALFLAEQAHVIGRFSSSRLDNLGGMDFSEANAFAAFVSVGVIFAGFYLLRVRLWTKFLLVLAIGLMLNSIVMAQSRGVFLGLIGAGLYVLMFMPKEKRKAIVACMFLGILLAGMLAGGGFKERMTTIGVSYDRFSGLTATGEYQIDRLDFWKASLKMLEQHPFGVGVKRFQKMVQIYDTRNPGMDAHNTYVLCYSEIGVPGLAIFIGIILFAFTSLWRVQRLKLDGTKDILGIRMTAVALGGALTVYLSGYGMTHSCLYSEILWILLTLPVVYESAVSNYVSLGAARSNSCLAQAENNAIPTETICATAETS